MDEILVKSKIRDYKVKFESTFDFINKIYNAHPNYVVVVGSIVYKIYKKKLFSKLEKNRLIVLPLDEKRKTIETVTKLYEALLKNPAKKNLTIISFGGGINQDSVGFVASTLYRGINWIYVPTTLLAQADSAIGSKTSLNFKDYKNVIGTFYPPTEIYINSDFLKTLKRKDYLSGVGEIVKFLLMKKNAIKDLSQSARDIKNLSAFSSKKHVLEIIKKSNEIKLSYIKDDEFDKGRRNLLNYGHEFGHALEATSSFAIPHGIAVIIGIIYANLVSLNRGLISEEIFDKVNEELLLPNIPHSLIKLKKSYFDSTSLLAKIKNDKKRISKDLPLILPDKDFHLMKITDLTYIEFKKNIASLIKILDPYLIQ